MNFRISRAHKDTHTQHTHTTHTHIHNDPVDENNEVVVNAFQNLAHLQRERERERHTHTCACEIPRAICVGCDILLGLVCVGLGVCGISLCGFWLSMKKLESRAPTDLCVLVLCVCQGISESRAPTKTHTHAHTQHTHTHTHIQKNMHISVFTKLFSIHFVASETRAPSRHAHTHTHTHNYACIHLYPQGCS